MDDTTSGLSEREMAVLCAFADGTLAPERRDEVAAWVATSPELLGFVERQRQSLTATRALANEPVPASLAAAIAARRSSPARRGRRRLGLALSAAGLVAAVAAAVVILSVSAGPARPTVADAAQFALQAPSGPPPGAVAGTTQLAADVQGLPFPDLSHPFGWRATGVRSGAVAGQSATVVYYQKGTRQMAYAIVAAPALPRPATGDVTTLDGVQFQTLSLRGRPVVTWRRLGHTCVMIGNASQADLLALAAWQGAGAAGY